MCPAYRGLTQVIRCSWSHWRGKKHRQEASQCCEVCLSPSENQDFTIDAQDRTCRTLLPTVTTPYRTKAGDHIGVPEDTLKLQFCQSPCILSLSAEWWLPLSFSLPQPMQSLSLTGLNWNPDGKRFWESSFQALRPWDTGRCIKKSGNRTNLAQYETRKYLSPL